LKGLADPLGYHLYRLAGGEPVGDLDAVVLCQVAVLIGVSMKRTLPASMNHNDPQLSDTPTALAATELDIPVRISLKYRRLTRAGILFGA
jgi:hypothetical protein